MKATVTQPLVSDEHVTVGDSPAHLHFYYDDIVDLIWTENTDLQLYEAFS